MKPMTVIELAELLDKAIKFGYGDRVVQVSNDEECNGYHCLYRRNFGSGEDVCYLDEKGGEVYRNSIILD